MALKKCFKCGKRKQRSEFYRHAMMADGLLGKCKECTKADVKRHRADNPEKLAAYEKRRGRTEERRTARRRYMAEQRRRFPEKFWARGKVAYAVRTGKMKRRPCFTCGSTYRLQAHHEDYSKPLDVRWLCEPCHTKEHSEP